MASCFLASFSCAAFALLAVRSASRSASLSSSRSRSFSNSVSRRLKDYYKDNITFIFLSHSTGSVIGIILAHWNKFIRSFDDSNIINKLLYFFVHLSLLFFTLLLSFCLYLVDFLSHFKHSLFSVFFSCLWGAFSFFIVVVDEFLKKQSSFSLLVTKYFCYVLTENRCFT